MERLALVNFSFQVREFDMHKYTTHSPPPFFSHPDGFPQKKAARQDLLRSHRTAFPTYLCGSMTK